MKRLFIIVVLLMFVSAFVHGQRQDLLGAEISYTGGVFSVENLYVDHGYKSENLEDAHYILRLVDENRNFLDELYFKLPAVQGTPDPDWFDAETGEQIIFPDFGELAIGETYYLPYRENIRYVSIFDITGGELFSLDVADFLLYCGDLKCQSYEGRDNCPQDCTISLQGCNTNGRCDAAENYRTCNRDCISGGVDGFCDGVIDRRCDPDCKASQDVDCKAQLEIGADWLVIAGAALGGLLLITLFILVVMTMWGGSER